MEEAEDPAEGGRPALPFVYSDEAWTGVEYQVAANLIYRGLLEEGLAIARGVSDRYDGVRRNPWNQIERGKSLLAGDGQLCSSARSLRLPILSH
jgi:uncharacterized protein (DUF608 family)